MDTSWKNNKRSLYGLATGVIFVAVARLIGLGGILEIVVFFIGFYIGYKYLGLSKDNTE